MKLQKLCYIATIALVACLAQTVSAQDTHWSGLGGDGLWGNPNNWDTGVVPPSGAGLANETGNLFLDAANGWATMTITNGEVESPGVLTSYPPASRPPWNTIYGPEFGANLDIYGRLNYDWVIAPVANDPTPGTPNRSHINMFNGSVLATASTGALALGDEWWWLGGPYVTMNMYGNSQVLLTNGAGIWLGGHLNIYDTATFNSGYLNLTSGGAVNNATRYLNLGGGTFMLPTGNSNYLYGLVQSSVIRAYGKGQATNQVVISDNGTNTIAAAIPLGGSTIARVYLAPLPVTTMQVGEFQRALLLADYPSVSGVLVSSETPGVDPTILPASATFNSSNPNVATVDSNGIVRAVSPGSATLSATLGSFNSTNTITVTVVPVNSTLVHRYSFNESSGTSAADSVGGSAWNATLVGTAAFNGSGQVVLDGATNDANYVQLPAGIISNMNDVTIEAWTSLGSSINNNWENLFAFGFSDTDPLSATYNLGGNYITFSPQTGGGGAQAAFGPGLPGNVGAPSYPVACEQDAAIGSTLSGMTNLQIVAVYSPSTGTQAFYTNGVLAASISVFNAMIDPVAFQDAFTNMSVLANTLGTDPNNYIGHSLYGADPGLLGSIDEFRIYNGPLTASQIAADYALGPNQLRGTGTSVSLSAVQSGGNMVFSWPTSSALVTLESSPTLGPSATWTPVAMPAGALATSGGNYEFTMPVSGTAQFYRLSE